MSAEPFEDSRRLTGCNVYFADCGAALETVGGHACDDVAHSLWRANIQAARAALGWADGPIFTRPHASGASLAFAAPLDQLYSATEVNEWAWWRASDAEAARYHAPGHAAVWDATNAMQTLRLLACSEANPTLIALRDAAQAQAIPFLADDDEVTLGMGEGGRTWFVDDLPSPHNLPWAALHSIPTALVTGSNGKTTTVRLLAAMCRAHGWATAHSCTDGVFFNGNELEGGDFSGPAGARTALRQTGAQAAILETARGGMLRRGLAMCRSNAAVVTNVSVDHFGEYGVHDLDDLTRVKLTVARAVQTDGLLVLNADDAMLRKHGPGLCERTAWFSLNFDQDFLLSQRANGGSSCGVRNGNLLLQLADGIEHDLGVVARMPLSLGGLATYNIANIAGAALTATALGIAPTTIAGVLRQFGTQQSDNPGRLQRWQFGNTQVFIDYAHNTEGLQGLFDAVGAQARQARLAILLGHAGNREDADLRAVASIGASMRPELVILKDIAGYERGRAAGEVARVMYQQLLDDGVTATRIRTCLDETEAVRQTLAWADDGDLLVLPVHESEARANVSRLLDEMTRIHWKAGDPLPTRD